MTGLARLLRTTAFRLSMIYLGLFLAIAAVAVGYIYYKTSALLGTQLENALEAELNTLNGHYRRAGLAGLGKTVAERSQSPGNGLYLLADAEGRHHSGNLKAVSSELWNTTGAVTFIYRRAVDSDIEERLAFAVVFRLANGFRLVVGRDIEDQRRFGAVVRSAFLWTLGGMLLFGVGGGLLIGRNLLVRIETMTDATRTIMDGDLSQRIPVGGSDDEFDRLAHGLNAMLARIEELIAGFKEVSDNIAHDLRTPLNRLRNRVEAALRENGSAEHYRDALQATIEDADDLIRTFNALLSIARLEAGVGERTDEHFDLATVVTDVAELYEPVAEELGIAFKIDASEQTMISGKRELIAQALANILDNAIKYGASSAKANGQSPDNCISVDLVSGQDSAEIIVADRGPGIPPEDRERVFKRFVRLETSRSLPGSGLGLSLAAAVARLHGGRLQLSDNAPGLRVALSVGRGNNSAQKPLT
ncbi:MAG: ATP-binding protein [Rhodomicrobiaceae bacterium]